MPLIDHFDNAETYNIRHAAQRDDMGRVLEFVHEAIWRRLAAIWNHKIWSFWIFKTIRVRDLRFLWVRFFGEPPADLRI